MDLFIPTYLPLFRNSFPGFLWETTSLPISPTSSHHSRGATFPLRLQGWRYNQAVPMTASQFVLKQRMTLRRVTVSQELVITEELRSRQLLQSWYLVLYHTDAYLSDLITAGEEVLKSGMLGWRRRCYLLVVKVETQRNPGGLVFMCHCLHPRRWDPSRGNSATCSQQEKQRNGQHGEKSSLSCQEP